MNKRLPITQTIFYGLPGLPLAMLGLPLFIYLPTFYNEHLGLSLSAVGLVLLLARSLDVITDPIIGFINDRYPKSQSIAWRRKSYMLAGVPLLLIGLNLLLKPNSDITASYLFLWSFVTYLGWTLINIPWLAMGAELSKNYHEKSNLASSREIFAAIGTVTVISIPVILALSSDLQATLEVLANLLTVVIPISLIPLILKCEFPSDTSSRELIKKPTTSAFKIFASENKTLLKHSAIKKILPAYFLNSVANALPATLFILYVSYVLKLPESIGTLLISYFMAAILGIPFWLYLAKKTDKHSSWRYALYGAIASFIWVPLLGAGDFTAFLIVCIASGFFLGADVVMPSSIQADISQKIAQDEESRSADTESYQNSTALIFGLWGMLTKLSLALAIGIAFPLLDLAGLQINGSNAEATNAYGNNVLILLYAIIPISLKIIVLIQMRDFTFGHDYFVNDPSSTSTLKDRNTSEGYLNENIQTENVNRPISVTPTIKRML